MASNGNRTDNVVARVLSRAINAVLFIAAAILCYLALQSVWTAFALLVSAAVVSGGLYGILGHTKFASILRAPGEVVGNLICDLLGNW